MRPRTWALPSQIVTLLFRRFKHPESWSRQGGFCHFWCFHVPKFDQALLNASGTSAAPTIITPIRILFLIAYGCWLQYVLTTEFRLLI